MPTAMETAKAKHEAAKRKPRWSTVGMSQANAPVYGTPPSGGSTEALAGLGSAYQSALDRANLANESRYEDILGGHEELYGRTMGAEAERSGQGEADIRTSFAGETAAGEQRMSSRGLAGTTIAETMRQGSAERETAAVNRFRDERLDRRTGLDVGLTGDRFDFMERREDTGPNQGLMAEIARMIGAGGGQLPPGLIELFTSMMGSGDVGRAVAT